MRSLRNFYESKTQIGCPQGSPIQYTYLYTGRFSKFLMLVTYHEISGNYYQIDIVVVERTCTSALGWFSISKRILLKTKSHMLEVK